MQTGGKYEKNENKMKQRKGENKTDRAQFLQQWQKSE